MGQSKNKEIEERWSQLVQDLTVNDISIWSFSPMHSQLQNYLSHSSIVHIQHALAETQSTHVNAYFIKCLALWFINCHCKTWRTGNLTLELEGYPGNVHSTLSEGTNGILGIKFTSQRLVPEKFVFSSIRFGNPFQNVWTLIKFQFSSIRFKNPFQSVWTLESFNLISTKLSEVLLSRHIWCHDCSKMIGHPYFEVRIYGRRPESVMQLRNSVGKWTASSTVSERVWVKGSACDNFSWKLMGQSDMDLVHYLIKWCQYSMLGKPFCILCIFWNIWVNVSFIALKDLRSW